MSVNTTEITQLAKVLHQNGDKVLNALSKLSLNAVLLQKLNEEFETLIENGCDSETPFQVISSNNGNSLLLKDLHFLHDFIQKTVGLKLTNSPSLSLLSNKVDISKFKSIKYLEIKKIPIKEVIGLKNIQSQLESIVCIRCLSKLEELLASCGGDNSSGFVWSELREAVLSFNNIEVVDTSVAFAPWLQVLDLSHNQITDVKAIECLPNLKYVNLSFNCLEIIPVFNKSARKKIELLVMKNNYIEDLSGLQGLSHLTELDLSNNWVSTTENLNSLLSMSALQWLSLSGNPISCHPNYRRSVAGYLHISASFSDFYLDKIKLSKKEKLVVGIKLSNGDQSLERSRISRNSLKSRLSSDENTNDQSGSTRKSGKARLVVIPNLDDGTYEEAPSDTFNSYFMSSSTEHLITKKRIENTRSTYGVDNWLVQGSSVVQDILGLPPVQITTSTPCDELCLQAALDSVKNVVTTTAIIETQPEAQLESSGKTKDSFVTCNEEDTSNYFSAETSAEKVENVENTENIENTESAENAKNAENSEIEKPEPIIEPSIEDSPDTEEIQEVEEVEIDENEKLYVVSKEVKTYNNEIKQEELFLTITDTELHEREPTKGKITTKWSLSSIESCVKLKPNQLQLVFDTVRRDKKERTYFLEEQEANTLYKQIAEILENRTLSDMNQIVYKCENCSSQFSKEMKSRKSDQNMWCPFCSSKFILQLDEVPLPSEEKKKNEMKNSKTPEVKTSHNRSSSAGGFFQSLLGQSEDKMLKCESQSSIGSAASLDEVNELPNFQNTNIKNSDSDIEILSNPSQSSIEVLDGPGRGNTPYRKRSSEERQMIASQTVIAATSLIQNNNPVGLTESSSSGSITDSICTAYESSSTVPPNKIEGTKDSLGKSEDVTISNESTSLHSEVKEQEKLENRKAVDPVINSYTNLDRTIKLFLYMDVFEKPDEEFSFVLEAFVLASDSENAFPCCIAASNKKIYFLKGEIPQPGDDPSKFLKKTDSLLFDLNAVKAINTLTWHQGCRVDIQLPKNKSKQLLILLKDPIRTKKFLTFLTSKEIQGFDKTNIITEPLERPYLAMQHLLLSSTSFEDSSIQYFCMFDSCLVFEPLKSAVEINSGGVLSNYTELLLFAGNMNWLSDNGDPPQNLKYTQKIRNLESVSVDRLKLTLNFSTGLEKRESWNVQMLTENAAESFLNAVKESWEKLFSVPLQLIMCDDPLEI